MSSRDVTLNALKGGINRLRNKGGADPSSLYDLVNAFVDLDGNIQSRPGTVKKVDLPSGTKGLCPFHGAFLVFSNVATPITDDGYTCEVLTNPNDPSQTIAEIHFAAPFMGFPYVVAEFANGDVFHYWLQSSGSWQADHVYLEGDIVEPSTPNGLAYKATGDDHPPAWQPQQQYTVGDEVQPTVYNGYKYRLVEASGESPASGTTEPDWPTVEGAQVDEDIDNTPQSSTTAPSTGTGTGTGDRYSNLPGYKQQQLGQNLT